MPRKGCVAKRDVLPDPIYNSKLVTRLINKMMLDGKKGTSQQILYTAFKIVEQKTGKNPLEVFDQALNNIMPSLELKVRRVGGANYQVPVEVSTELELLLRNVMIHTEWLKLIRLSLTSVGNRWRIKLCHANLH